MTEDPAQVAAREIRRNYDRCTAAIEQLDPDAFVTSFGPTARGETAEGTPITMEDTRDYWVWRFGRTVTTESFVVEIDSVEGGADEVWIEFTEDSSATVLDGNDEPATRTAHSRNRVRWRREQGEWSQVGGVELEVSRTLDGAPLSPDDDPIGVPAYRRARAAKGLRTGRSPRRCR